VNYNGRLYGKNGTEFFPLVLNSSDVDLLELKVETCSCILNHLDAWFNGATLDPIKLKGMVGVIKPFVESGSIQHLQPLYVSSWHHEYLQAANRAKAMEKRVIELEGILARGINTCPTCNGRGEIGIITESDPCGSPSPCPRCNP
jgi:hypothetical protein